MSSSYDAIVIGLGGMGSSTALSLAKRGAKVLGLEQFTLAHDRGSSHGERRLIRQAYFEHPDYVPLLKSAYKRWDALCIESAENLFYKNGLLIVGSKESAVLEGCRQSARLHQVTTADVSNDELKTNFPQLKLPNGYQGVFEPGAGFLKLEESIKAFCRLAIKHGAQLNFEEPVLSWKAKGEGVTVKTSKGIYEAAKLILAAGPWSLKLLQGLKIPLEVRRAPQFWFNAPPSFKSNSKTPCLAFDMPYGFFYGFPENQGLMKLATHTPGEIISDPSQVDRKITVQDHGALSRFISEVLPDADYKPARGSICMYTMTPDENFVIDIHPDFRQVSFAGGFSGHGYKFASVVGPILADLALENSTDEPIDFLRLRWN